MAMHDYHVPVEGAILYDGCAECDRRAADPLTGLLNLDATNFARLHARMVAVELEGDADHYRSINEATLAKALYRIHVLAERHPGWIA